MHRSTVRWVARAGVVALAISPVPCRAQRAGALLTMDTSAVRVISSAIVFYADSDGLSRAARPAAKAWDIVLPLVGDTSVWSALRARLYGRVNGRPFAPSDSAGTTLRVSAAQVGDTVTFTINTGERLRCGNQWRDAVTSNQYRAIRTSGAWGPPMPIKASVADPVACR